jgi:hypothetical protein
MPMLACHAPPGADVHVNLSAFGGLTKCCVSMGTVPSISSSALGATSQPLLDPCPPSDSLLSKMTCRS